MTDRHAPTRPTVRTAVWLAVAFVFTMTVCTAGIWDRLHDPYAVHNDLATSIFWMHRLTDPGLFPGSLMAEYSASRTSPAIRAVYWIGTRFTDPVTISRLFPFPAIALLTWIGFGVGRRLGGDAGGALFAAAFIVNTWFLTLGPGTSGEFAPILYLLFAYALVRGSVPWAGAVLVLAAFAYPPAALVGGSAFAACVALQWTRGQVRKRDLAVLAASGAAALGVLWLAYRSGPSKWGPMVTRAQMERMPEFGWSGRLPYFFGTLFSQLQSDTTGLELQNPMIYMLAAAAVLGVARFRFLRYRIPAGLWLLAAAGAVWFAAAYWLMLRLLAPTKYIAQPLAILATGIGVAGVFSLSGRRVRALAAATYLAGGLVVSYPFLAEKEDRPPTTAVLEAVGGLPEDAVVAGLPETMNWVAIFGKRSVYVCREAAEPYFTHYYREAARRIDADLRAYYAAELKDVIEFCVENGVTHFLVVRSEFDEAALVPERIYSEPFGSRIAAWIGRRREFALLHPPREWVVYEDPEALLVAPRGSAVSLDTVSEDQIAAPFPPRGR